MSIWAKYKIHITNNLTPAGGSHSTLEYWCNRLFTVTIIYLVPLSLVAIIPGIYYTFITNQLFIFYVDLFTLAGVVVIALIPGINIHTRKIFFIATAYLIGCILLFLTGLNGAGLLYLQVACIYSILIFPSKRNFWKSAINLFISIAFIVTIYFELTPIIHTSKESVSEWIAILANLIFLSLLSVAFIPQLLIGLQESLEEEKALKQQLSSQQQSLLQTLRLLEKKNAELSDIAYLQSHIMRAPVANILGIIQLIQDEGIKESDKNKLYNDLLVSVKALDDIIHDVSDKAHQAKVN